MHRLITLRCIHEIAYHRHDALNRLHFVWILQHGMLHTNIHWNNVNVQEAGVRSNLQWWN